MPFEEIVDQALALLQRRGRAYRTLKRQFELDDDALEDLKIELIQAQRLAADEGGAVLVWTGAGAPPQFREAESPSAPRRELSTPAGPLPASLRPIAYTPRIWPSASAPSKRRWKRAVRQMASARPSPPCLPISKARRR